MEAKAGTQAGRQELKQRLWRNAAYWPAQFAFSLLFFSFLLKWIFFRQYIIITVSPPPTPLSPPHLPSHPDPHPFYFSLGNKQASKE